MTEKTEAIEAIQVCMGWNDITLLMFALRFIAETGLNEDFEAYLNEQAVELDADYRGGTTAAEADDVPDDHHDSEEN